MRSKVSYLSVHSRHCSVEVKSCIPNCTCQHFVLRSLCLLIRVCHAQWTLVVVKLDKGDGKIVFLLLWKEILKEQIVDIP